LGIPPIPSATLARSRRHLKPWACIPPPDPLHARSFADPDPGQAELARPLQDLAQTIGSGD